MIVKVIEEITPVSISIVNLSRDADAWVGTIEVEGILGRWHYEDTENPSYIELWSCHA